MPVGSIEFRVPGSAAAIRSVLLDPEAVARLIPQVVAVERTGERTANWTVLLKIGPLQRRSLYRGELVDSSAEEVHFRAVGSEARIEGRVRLAPESPSSTGVTLTLSMEGQGALRAVVDAYLAKRVRTDVEQFASALTARLRGSNVSPS